MPDAENAETTDQLYRKARIGNNKALGATKKIYCHISPRQQVIQTDCALPRRAIVHCIASAANVEGKVIEFIKDTIVAIFDSLPK